MDTIARLELHAAEIMAKGGPSDKNEFAVMKIWKGLHSGKAGNAGKYRDSR